MGKSMLYALFGTLTETKTETNLELIRFDRYGVYAAAS